MKCAANIKERKRKHPCADGSEATSASTGVVVMVGVPSVAPADGGVPPCSTSAAPPAVALVLEEQRGQIAVVQATPAEESALTVGQTEPVERASTRNTCTGFQDSQTVCYGDY